MANQIRTSLVLFILALGIFLLGNQRHGLWDRDEPRYAVATREMLATGDWIIPHFNGAIRYDKPVLIYWLMALPMKLFGEMEFGARFVSALMGALRVVAVFWFARALGAGARGAILAALIALFGAIFVVISKAATTDSTLVLTVVGALYVLWLQERDGFRWSRHVIFWVILGVSALLKGPPGLGVVALTWMFFELSNWFTRRRGHPAASTEKNPAPAWLIRTPLGLLVFLVTALPWLIPVWLRTDGYFIRHAIDVHVIGRVSKPMEGHGGWLVYYIPVLLVGLIPFTAVWLNGAAWSWRRLAEPRMRFLWSWFVPGLVMFTASGTKLPHYIAPLLPALALMAGLWWSGEVERKASSPLGGVGKAWWVAGGIFMLLCGIGVGGGIPVAVELLKIPAGPVPMVLVCGVLFAALCGGAMQWLRLRPAGAVGIWTVGWTLAVILTLVWVLPEADALRPSRPVGLWIRDHVPGDARLVMVEYDEPSLVFYSGRPIEGMGTSERREVFRLLDDLQSPTALITTEERWEKFVAGQNWMINPEVTVRYKLDSFYFEQGEPMTVVVVGNWPESAADRQDGKGK